MKTSGRSAKRWLVMGAGLVLALDLMAWAGHVAWRDNAVDDLSTMVEEIERLADEISADDAWIGSTTRLMQEYGQPNRLAERMQARGQRVAAHKALVDAYNGRVTSLYDRFYWAPLPRPEPPTRHHLQDCTQTTC